MATKINMIAVPLFAFPFFITCPAWADAAPTFLPATPGITLSGYAGNGWTEQTDVLIPIFGKPSNFTYIDSQFLYHSQGGMTGSVGLGQRWLSQNNIFGLYVFTDYNHSPQNKNFWFASPGFEYIGSIFNFSLNGYIPVSKEKYYTGTIFSDQNNDFSKTYFSGHQQYSELLDTFEATAWGADALIGFHLPFRNMQFSVGSYYFSPKNHSDVIGGIAKLDIPINNYLSGIVSEAYDNLTHHTIKVGLSVSLGGRHNQNNFHDVKQHLVDPVNRQLIAINGGSHTGEPVVKTVKDTGKMGVEKDNISFFTSANTENKGDGTYENPYQVFSQINIDDANKQNNRNFYLNSGAYNAQYAVDKNEITLDNDILFGRQENFLKPATGDNRPLLSFDQGGITVSTGDQQVALNNLVLKGSNTGTGDGIGIDHLDNDSTISLTVSNLSIDGFNHGIRVNSVSEKAFNVSIDNTNISNNTVSGITAQNNGKGGINLFVNKSQINNNGQGIVLADYQAGNLTAKIYKSEINENVNQGLYAINLFNPGTLRLDIYGSTIDYNGYHGVQLYNGNSYSINSGNIIANINNSNITNNGANGIYASNISTGDLSLNINNSNINNNSWTGITAINTMDSGSFIFNLKNSQVNDNYASGLVIFNEKNSGSFTANIQKSTIKNNFADGIFIDNSQSSGNLNVKIADSSISGNLWDGIFALNDSNIGNLNLIIDNSQINHNGASALYLDNNSQGGSLNTSINHSQMNDNGSGGVSVLNEKVNGSMDLKISNSVISGNGGDGLSLYEMSLGGKISAEVNNSSITNNMGYALGARNNVMATVNDSIISGNDLGIIAMDGGIININNPKYLDGNILSPDGTINFNGIQAPSEATYAHCESNQCSFSN